MSSNVTYWGNAMRWIRAFGQVARRYFDMSRPSSGQEQYYLDTEKTVGKNVFFFSATWQRPIIDLWNNNRINLNVIGRDKFTDSKSRSKANETWLPYFLFYHARCWRSVPSGRIQSLTLIFTQDKYHVVNKTTDEVFTILNTYYGFGC